MNNMRYALAAATSLWMLIPWGVQAQVSITSPADGSVWHAGDTIQVQIKQPAGGLVILGGDSDLKISSDELTAAPYTFSVKVPEGISVGTYRLSAITPVQPPATTPAATSIHLIIEPAAPPIGATLSVSSPELYFDYRGQIQDVRVYLNSGGTLSDISSSSQLVRTSADPSIVSVKGKKLMAGARGSTTVTISSGAISTQLPVYNRASSVKGDLDGNGIVDIDDVNILLSALNSRANDVSDARDLNGDGLINAADATVLASLCTPSACHIDASSIPPVPPTSLTAIGGDRRVTLRWAATTGATSYAVFEGIAADGESSMPLLTGVTSTTATITGLASSTSYYFKVNAGNSGGISPLSNEATAITTAPSGSSGSSSGTSSGSSGSSTSGGSSGGGSGAGSSSGSSSGGSSSGGSSSSGGGSTGSSGSNSSSHSGGGGAIAPSLAAFFAGLGLLRYRRNRARRS
jgi:hypothetical protein